jgi:protein O-GlcNAc transferase
LPSVADSLAEAVRQHRAGKLAEAEALYRGILAANPKHADVLHLLGIVAHQTKRLDLAEELITQAVTLKPGFAHAHHNLGRVLWERGKRMEAAAQHRRAIELQPGHVEARIHYGNTLLQERKVAEALAQFERAVALQPKLAAAHNALGSVLRTQGKAAESIACYRRALELDPDFVPAPVNLGTALRGEGRFEEAIECYERALARQPDLAEAHNNLGNAFQELGRNDAAIQCYERALDLRADYARVHTNLGIALGNLGRHEEALARHERALALEPDAADAQASYAIALQSVGRMAEAAPHHERALALDPNMAKSRLGSCMAQLRVLYDDAAEIAERRAVYDASLRRLVTDDGANSRAMAEALGNTLPFYLAYQGECDRDLQMLHGGFACRVMAQHFPAASVAPPPAEGESVRVGFVSGFFWRHSVWKIPLKGWLGQLDRQRFQLLGYHTSARRDAETKIAADLCDRFVQGPLPMTRWRDTILADRPHVLIYPEIGMDKATAQLAAQRLAAVQCTSWGHPDTSGFPTLDYYLSSALMEPADGDAHYSERLVRLPNLSVYYDPPAVPAVALERAALGLRPNATVFWCGQSLFKYLPQHDDVFPRIAKGVGDCQFVFVEFTREGPVTAQFRRRLDRAFAAAGLTAEDHCVMLQRLEIERFVAAIGRCDVFLDSIGWSGCNSTLESLAHNLPIVTLAGPLMRGRHSAAILAMMGIAETVADSVDDYVAKAVRLASDADWRARMRRAIADNKHRVYRDRAPIEALEDFLDRVARPS